MAKLYVVTRADLTHGEQACQLAHAAREFAAKFPEEEQLWYNESNHICFLVVSDITELTSVWNKAREKDIRSAPFYEDDELTAIAFEPSLRSRRLLSQIPLAFK